MLNAGSLLATVPLAFKLRVPSRDKDYTLEASGVLESQTSKQMQCRSQRGLPEIIIVTSFEGLQDDRQRSSKATQSVRVPGSPRRGRAGIGMFTVFCSTWCSAGVPRGLHVPPLQQRLGRSALSQPAPVDGPLYSLRHWRRVLCVQMKNMRGRPAREPHRPVLRVLRCALRTTDRYANS